MLLELLVVLVVEVMAMVMEMLIPQQGALTLVVEEVMVKMVALVLLLLDMQTDNN